MSALAAAAMNCWAAAAQTFGLPPYLLYSVASVESGYNPEAVAYAKNGTISVGLMQINSSWFPTLKKAGIDPEQLHDPCINVYVGAYILAQGVDHYGYTWKAIGSYYAGDYDERKLSNYLYYSNLVLSRWRRAEAGELQLALTNRRSSYQTKPAGTPAELLHSGIAEIKLQEQGSP